MNQPKSPFQSITIWGAIGSAFLTVMFAIQTPVTKLAEAGRAPNTAEWVGLVYDILGAIAIASVPSGVTIYGRFHASSSIKPLIPGAAAAEPTENQAE